MKKVNTFSRTIWASDLVGEAAGVFPYPFLYSSLAWSRLRPRSGSGWIRGSSRLGSCVCFFLGIVSLLFRWFFPSYHRQWNISLRVLKERVKVGHYPNAARN